MEMKVEVEELATVRMNRDVKEGKRRTHPES